MRPGRYPTDVAVTSREHPDASVVDRVDVEVLPFVALETTLAPSVLRAAGRPPEAQVANRGNAPVELALGGDDPEAAFSSGSRPSRLRLEPGAAGAARSVVKARKENRSRADLTRPFRVLAGRRRRLPHRQGTAPSSRRRRGGRRGWQVARPARPPRIVALFLASIYEPARSRLPATARRRRSPPRARTGPRLSRTWC